MLNGIRYDIAMRISEDLRRPFSRTQRPMLLEDLREAARTSQWKITG